MLEVILGLPMSVVTKICWRLWKTGRHFSSQNKHNFALLPVCKFLLIPAITMSYNNCVGRKTVSLTILQITVHFIMENNSMKNMIKLIIMVQSLASWYWFCSHQLIDIESCLNFAGNLPGNYNLPHNLYFRGQHLIVNDCEALATANTVDVWLIKNNHRLKYRYPSSSVIYSQ